MKKYYEWRKHELRKIEIMGPEDIEKKPEIPSTSKFAELHQRHLDNKSKRKKK